MRWRRGILAVGVTAMLFPTAAMARQLLTVFGGGSAPVTATTLPVRITGTLSVTFHGDLPGCARWGLCGYSGTVSWQPPPTASLEIDRIGGRHSIVAVNLFPNFTAGPQTQGGVTSASVTMAGGASAPASRCLDATQTGEVASLRVTHGRVRFSLARDSPSLLLTRCAGPRDADVLPHLPAPTIPLTALQRGQMTVSLAGSQPLASHGFAGSITSTLAVHLGRPGKPRTERNGSQKRGRAGRELKVTYRAKLSGTIVEQVRGAADPLVCQALGSCGLTGTITLTPPAAATTVHLTVDARASTPRREILAAAGLDPGGSGRVGGFGLLSWDTGGAVVTDLRQGSAQCRDTAPGGGLALLIATGHGRLRVSMVPGVITAQEAATRCPGPALSMTTMGSGSAPLSALAAKTASIGVTAGSTGRDDGYRMRIVPHLTLTLARVKVRLRAIRIPPGEVLPRS